MHKVIKINEFAATRMVELQNELTGNIDICFDDSALVSINNFEFMKAVSYTHLDVYKRQILLIPQRQNRLRVRTTSSVTSGDSFPSRGSLWS